MNQEQINLAIRDCLRLCYSRHNILPTVAAFVAGIEAAGGWTDEEIRALEIGIHGMLRHILAPVYPVDATDQPVSDRREDVKSAKFNSV